MQEAPAVLHYVLAPGLCPNHVEEACVATQLLPKHWPERGFGAQDLQPSNARVDTILQGTHLRSHWSTFSSEWAGVSHTLPHASPLERLTTQAGALAHDGQQLQGTGPRAWEPPTTARPTCWQRFMRIWMTGQKRFRFSRRVTRLAEGITFTWRGGGVGREGFHLHACG